MIAGLVEGPVSLARDNPSRDAGQTRLCSFCPWAALSMKLVRKHSMSWYVAPGEPALGGSTAVEPLGNLAVPALGRPYTIAASRPASGLKAAPYGTFPLCPSSLRPSGLL